MIGLDVSDQSVKIVQLTNDALRQLVASCWQAMPAGLVEHGVIQQEAAVTKVLTEAFRLCQLGLVRADAVVASIPETQSFLRVIELPAMAVEEMDEAVRWEVAQHIPFGLDNVYIDWQAIGQGHTAATGRQEVLVGAAQRKVIDPLVRVLTALKVDVAALELESQAITRALVSAELRSHQGLVIVDLGGSATNVVIHDHGTMRFSASLQRGTSQLSRLLSAEDAQRLRGPRSEVLSAEVAQRVAERMRSGQEELVMEIHGIVEFYNGIDAQHRVREILLTGGGSNLPGLDRIFLRFFDNVHVQRGDPWANIIPVAREKKPPLPLRESVHFATSLGLALRSVDR